MTKIFCGILLLAGILGTAIVKADENVDFESMGYWHGHEQGYYSSIAHRCVDANLVIRPEIKQWVSFRTLSERATYVHALRQGFIEGAEEEARVITGCPIQGDHSIHQGYGRIQ